jgi:hypothetical protein
MNTIKIICLTAVQWIKQACLLPKSIMDAILQRKQNALRKEVEAERLDRIRNPSNYAGK